MLKVLLSLVFVAMVSFASVAAPPSVVMVTYSINSERITLTRGPGKTETLSTKSALDKNKYANREQLHQVLTSLYEEGYTLQSSTVTGSNSVNTEAVNYLFVKP